MTLKISSPFKVAPDQIKPDSTLKEEQGWHKMDVRWLVTDKTMPSQMTVVGRTILPPGVGAKHARHRHPYAEEWEYVIHGKGIKHVGKESFLLQAGELAFVPRDTDHGLENASDNEPLITLWGYSGAPSLEKAGYIVPNDDTEAPVDSEPPKER
jgi:quercetin dioxygenase-like cupin family protein